VVIIVTVLVLDMEVRQLIYTASKPSKSKSTVKSPCSAFTLPSNGVLILNSTTTITLSSDASYQPLCNDSSSILITESGTVGQIHFRDPFYASTLPECYALAATTVIAYMLVIMLLVTPRRFLDDGATMLQKAAALTVAISLTIATADTFKVAEMQYNLGYMDADALQKKVEQGTELKIIRIISDTFLWLAQAQTLIRLFPRQREKVIIKWTAFALITLDELFSTLNAFAYKNSSRPRSFVDAVPALAYLFQLALSLLYAAWVVYYSFTKRKFAFYHPQMKNICLVALLSLISILVPVVFFVTDISKPDLAGWGDYVRWLGAAAASVVVWEWVERIEALERNDKKDGVLGREVFDDDEIFDISQSTDFTHESRFSRFRQLFNLHSRDEQGVGFNSKRAFWPFISDFVSRWKCRRTPDIETGNSLSQSKCENIQSLNPPKKPLPAVTSINRPDTQSAGSTVYPVGYHKISEDLPLTTNFLQNPEPTLSTGTEVLGQSSMIVDNRVLENRPGEEQIENSDTLAGSQHCNLRGPFTRIEKSKDVSQKEEENSIQATLKTENSVQSQIKVSTGGIRARVENLISAQANKIRAKKSRRG
ncbi:hypothetical protein EPUL_006378, partial [Erysiphe pulchra]